MITGKKFVIIANISNTQNSTTGDRTKIVTDGKKIVAKVELVGVQTAQLGQTQGFKLDYSVEIARIQYNNEKYVYFDSNIYEIKSMSKAKQETKMLLNVQKLNDSEIKNAIEEWLQWYITKHQYWLCGIL